MFLARVITITDIGSLKPTPRLIVAYKISQLKTVFFFISRVKG